MSNKNETIEGLGAELYDQHITETDDVEFILSVIGETSKKVLEVCCGSGRIFVPLAKVGHDVTGFDADESMIDRIPLKAAGLENIQWRKADAVYDDWGTDFDVVVLAGNILFNIASDMEYKKSAGTLHTKSSRRAFTGRLCLYRLFSVCSEWPYPNQIRAIMRRRRQHNLELGRHGQ